MKSGWLNCFAILASVFFWALPAPAAEKEIYSWGLSNPGLVDGRIIARKWADLEPQKGKFNWQDFDNALGEVKAAGKKVIFWVSFLPTATKGRAPVKAVPSWLNAKTYTVTKKGVSVNFIIPWDEVFLAEWKRFAQALAFRYDGNPSVRCIRLVETGLTGVTRYGETFKELQRQGYTLEKHQEAMRAILGAFEDAFKVTPICQNLNFPLGDPEFKEPGYLENRPEEVEWLDSFCNYAVSKYQTILFFDGLVERPVPKDFFLQKIFRKYQDKTIVGAAIPQKAKDIKGTVDWALEMADFKILVADASNPESARELRRWKESE
ncbi:MAG: beta-galactosidase [Candidatus Omnitrophota bacterium]